MNKILNIIKKILIFFKNQFVTLSKGEYPHFYTMLYVYSVLPALLIFFISKKNYSINLNNYVVILTSLLMIIYFIWHIYVVKKTLKVQPQYVVKKITKKELYANKTPEEIKQIKKDKKIKTVKKLLLLEAWDSAPIYTIVELVDVAVIIFQFQRILNIIDN